MHAIYASFLAIAALAVAQDLSDTTEAIKLIPACALGCFTEGIGNSTCGPTDAYCQCTSGAADIAKVLVPCLCQSMASGTCTADDLMKADEATMKICTAALKTKGETFKAPPVDPSMCSAFTGSSGGSASGNTTAGNSTSSENTTSTGTGTSSGASSSGTSSGNSSSSSTSGAPTVGAIESFKFLITCGMLGLAGVALMVL